MAEREYLDKDLILSLADQFYDEEGGQPTMAVPVCLIKALKSVRLPDKASYETVLTVSKWIVGKNWEFQAKEVGRREVSADQVDWWKKALNEDGNEWLFKYAQNYFMMDGGEPGSMFLWKLSLVRTDEDGDQLVMASASAWESKLREGR